LFFFEKKNQKTFSPLAAAAFVGQPAGYFRVVGLLLATARRRAASRMRQQIRLFQGRGGGQRRLGFIMFVLIMAGVNLLSAAAIQVAVSAGQRQNAAAHGRIMVEDRFVAGIDALRLRARQEHWPAARLQSALEKTYGLQARTTALFYGGDENARLTELKNTVPGVTDAPDRALRVPAGRFADMPRSRSLTAFFTSLLLLMWSAMLVFQGEGLELEVQRSRHPMWEFLFSHPVPPSAVFLAEILAPLAANPIYYSAPVFAGVLYGRIYGPALGVLATVLVGMPITVAASCLGKALEIGVILRLPARSRGAMAGVMSWLGYSCMMLLGVAAFTVGALMHATWARLHVLGELPWSALEIFLGRGPGGFVFARGAMTCAALAALIMAGSVGFSVWSARHGVTGQGAAPAVRRREAGGGFGKHALYRKEMLWLLRDRNAAVQAILIPVTLAGFQLLNFRLVLTGVTGTWNLLCGTAILFGVYFLSVLCPKSLASEGPALWVALTWPRGLEELLKAKARLWAMIATVIVGLVLGFAVIRFPAHAWSIALVAAGWFLLAGSLSEKAVTLVMPSTENGQTDKIPLGERLAAHLGTFPFSIGVMTQQWHLVLAGVVFSAVTAGAMWRRFAASLPYFHDAWSARRQAAPSLVQAMIAVSTLVELGTLLGAVTAVTLGRGEVDLAYGVLTPVITLLAVRFLRGHGVRLGAIWHWQGAAVTLPKGVALAGAACAGLALGVMGAWCETALRRGAGGSLAQAAAPIALVPHAQQIMVFLGVCVTPICDELLFRGLVFRALDREWDGWWAVLGSAGLFAVYHPAASWLPLGLLGVCAALLFKRTGSLTATVVLHGCFDCGKLTDFLF
jgi:membrane protease YdiL (CAAX protease family)